MKSLILRILNSILSPFGYSLKRSGPSILDGKRVVYPKEKDIFKWLQQLNIRTIIDVGAHKGEFARQFHRLFPHASIYSFEPLSEMYKELKRNLKDVPGFQAFNYAVGEIVGEKRIHHHQYSQSSSILEMSDIHKKAFPFTAQETVESIHINTLDNLLSDLSLRKNILLKIDVQGYENSVLNGAENTLRQVKAIIVEMSYVELYKGQSLFHDIYQRLYSKNFIYRGCLLELKNPQDGTPLQQDSIFIREDE